METKRTDADKPMGSPKMIVVKFDHWSKAGNHVKATIAEDRKGVCAVGGSRAEAVGKLMLENPAVFGLEIQTDYESFAPVLDRTFNNPFGK